MKPRVCILKTDGTNCDQETFHALERAGAQPEIVLLNQLLIQKNVLQKFQVLVIPGGFSYGDDIASGKILALELMQFLHDELNEFVAAGKGIIGICNGFQVLVRAGLLPHLHEETSSLNNQEVTLTTNDSGNFECRWVELKIEKTNCIFTRGIEQPIMLPVAHAEGKFFAAQKELDAIEDKKMVVFRYAKNNQATDQYPYNPNGSLHNIAGICDSTGRILGLMPHPERFVYPYQHPLYKQETIQPVGIQIFKNIVHY